MAIRAPDGANNFLDIDFVYLRLSSTLDPPLSGGRHTITVRNKIKGSDWERRDDELGGVCGEEFPVKVGPRACSDVEFRYLCEGIVVHVHTAKGQNTIPKTKHGMLCSFERLTKTEICDFSSGCVVEFIL